MLFNKWAAAFTFVKMPRMPTTGLYGFIYVRTTFLAVNWSLGLFLRVSYKCISHQSHQNTRVRILIDRIIKARPFSTAIYFRRFSEFVINSLIGFKMKNNLKVSSSFFSAF